MPLKKMSQPMGRKSEIKEFPSLAATSYAQASNKNQLNNWPLILKKKKRIVLNLKCDPLH